MAINTYRVGALVLLSAVFTVASTATDPTSVTGKIILPDGTEDDLTIATKDSVGHYHADYSPLVAGEYLYEIVGTGTCQAAATGQFQVLPNPF